MNNPLNHFGIQNRMIRGDTNSYNRKTLTKEQAAELFKTGGTPLIKTEQQENLTEKGLREEREKERLHRKKHSSYY